MRAHASFDLTREQHAIYSDSERFVAKTAFETLPESKMDHSSSNALSPLGHCSDIWASDKVVVVAQALRKFISVTRRWRVS